MSNPFSFPYLIFGCFIFLILLDALVGCCFLMLPSLWKFALLKANAYLTAILHVTVHVHFNCKQKLTKAMHKLWLR